MSSEATVSEVNYSGRTISRRPQILRQILCNKKATKDKMNAVDLHHLKDRDLKETLVFGFWRFETWQTAAAMVLSYDTKKNPSRQNF